MDFLGKGVWNFYFYKYFKWFLGKNKYGKLGKEYRLIFFINLVFAGGEWGGEGFWVKVVEDID